MKLWTTEHTFKHSWTKVTEAAWKKYPNEHNPNVYSIDVVDRKISGEGQLITTRIFGSQWSIPKFITTALGMPEMCYAVEHSEVDAKNEKMTLKTINYTFWGYLAVEETLVYQGNKNNPNETKLSQGAKISVNGIQFANYFEGLIVNSFDATSKKGRTALEQVIHKIKVEDLLESVSNEIADIKENIDQFDTEYHVIEKLKILGEDLDNASILINSELQVLSNKVSTEFTELISNLGKELEQINLKVSKYESNFNGDNVPSLTEAVRAAGIRIATS